jgi:cell wall-associated NlpC family hydrolase
VNTVGYLSIIVALFALRGLTKGRSITELPTDLGDAFTSLVNNDPAKLKEVLSRGPDAPTAVTPLSGGVTPPEAAQAAANAGVPGAAATALAFARAQIGKPYVWGATGPNAFDCSGLTMRAYEAAGHPIPRVSQAQVLIGTNVPRSALVIGDLVFPDLGHVQIYAGNGNIVEAAKPGTLVREVPIWGFFTARRVIGGTDTSRGHQVA